MFVTVRIKVPGPYRKLTVEGTQPVVGAEQLKIGDIRTYDRLYANILLDNDLVTFVGESENIDDSKEETDPPMEEPKVEINASQNARKLASDNGLDLSEVKGTGPGGKITIRDVTLHLREQEDDD